MLTLAAMTLGFAGGYTAAWAYRRLTAVAETVGVKPKRVWRCRRRC